MDAWVGGFFLLLLLLGVGAFLIYWFVFRESNPGCDAENLNQCQDSELWAMLEEC